MTLIQSGIIRTIELIMRFPSMSQYDAISGSLWHSSALTPGYLTYTAGQGKIDDRDKKNTELAKVFTTFELPGEDDEPDDLFNGVMREEIIDLHSLLPLPITTLCELV